MQKLIQGLVIISLTFSPLLSAKLFAGKNQNLNDKTLKKNVKCKAECARRYPPTRISTTYNTCAKSCDVMYRVKVNRP